MLPLQRIIEENGPTVFSARRLANSDDIFADRAALFYTPTRNIPSKWIGHGRLDLILPIPVPTFFDRMESRLFGTPRTWVELLQRATHKLRWRPMISARVQIIRYDSKGLQESHLCVKELLDALKIQTSGRRDGRSLHYFGAIFDDAPNYLSELCIEQRLVTRPSEAKTRVVVEVA
jgi:hypothetical protein